MHAICFCSVNFRFQDVKKLLYDEAARRAGGPPPPGSAVLLRLLTQNFRSHNGLVAASAAVAGIVEELIPNAIDHLATELGFFQGPRPLIINVSDIGRIVSILLDADKADDGSAEPLDFGANQVILVRSAAARDKLYAAAPELKLVKALVLTVAESKGLEWNDVFIVNMFADSPATHEWRVIAGLVERRWDRRTCGELSDEELLVCDRHLLRPLPLDEKAHAALIDEMKLLYVAVTRARRRVVICDTDPHKRAPIFAFLTSPVGDAASGVRPPVAVVGDRPAARAAEMGGSGFAQASTSAEWAQRAAAFAARGLLAQAAQCFMYAGRERDAAAALAQLAQREADDAAAGNELERYRARTLEAARQHVRAGAPRRAVECLRATGGAAEAALADALDRLADAEGKQAAPNAKAGTTGAFPAA